MIDLQRLTMEYVANEDRLSLTANVQSGGTARLWLTRRIADRMVAALATSLQPRHRDRAYAELLDAFAQQHAEQRHEPLARVKADSPDHEWLVRKLTLRFPESGVLIILTGAEGEEARMVLSAELLRQWLGILRKVYHTAEWTTESWPEAARSRPALPQHSVVLH
jgi:hypothetical protein